MSGGTASPDMSVGTSGPGGHVVLPHGTESLGSRLALYMLATELMLALKQYPARDEFLFLASSPVVRIIVYVSQP